MTKICVQVNILYLLMKIYRSYHERVNFGDISYLICYLWIAILAYDLLVNFPVYHQYYLKCTNLSHEPDENYHLQTSDLHE